VHCIEPQDDDEMPGDTADVADPGAWRISPGAWRGGWATTISVTMMAGLVTSLPGVLTGCTTLLPAPVPSTEAAEATRSGKAVDAPVAGNASPSVPLPPARNWDEYRERAARRLVEANPERIYHGAVPEPLLAIPVLEIELKADGQVVHINVLRQPSQARDTVKIAMDAVYKAAPYGDVHKLPKPWKFTEVFLFNEDRQFKPRTLDQ